MLEDLPPVMHSAMGTPEDFPDGVVPKGYDVASLLGVLWAAVRELDAELDALRALAKQPLPSASHDLTT